MKGYKIEMMTHADAFAYYGGSNNYAVKKVIIIAKNEEKAVEKAKMLYPDMEINTHYVRETEIPAGHVEQMMIADLL